MNSEWIFAFGSVIGNSHIQAGLPCQDNCRVASFPEFTIAVVADGAGSCENSHLGSSASCDSSVRHFSELIKNEDWGNKLPDQVTWHIKAKETLFKIKSDLENLSLEEDIPFKSLSCTLIITIILENGILVTHVGDGRAGYCNENFEWFPTITPFHGQEANETVFITSSIWDDALIDLYIESKVVEGNIQAVCLLSDGAEKAAFECNLYDEETGLYHDPNLPYKDFFHKNVTIHLPNLKSSGKTQAEINDLWKKFLTAGNEKLKIEPDDKTIILGTKLKLPADGQTYSA